MVKYSKVNDPGTGTQYTINSKRIINRDGSFNVIKSGLRFSTRDAYHTVIAMSWSRFFLIIFIILFLINAFFAAIYSFIGITHIGGTSTTFTDDFLEAFYFSFQTFTTVGYGVLHPIGHVANIIATFESTAGWMCFALITGILYGRFSKPSARLMYSEKALITPYKNGLKSLQFRVANMRKSNLMEMETTVLLVLVEKEEDGKGIRSRNFINLKLERNSILFFPLNWTIVHPIDEDSPFYGKTKDEMKAMDTEILVRIKGFDDTFSQVVHSRYSYKCNEIIWGGKYKPSYQTHQTGDIFLYFDKMHEYDEVDVD